VPLVLTAPANCNRPSRPICSPCGKWSSFGFLVSLAYSPGDSQSCIAGQR
jgi:hypothetical protein